MTTVAEVKLWGETVGAVALESGAVTASFQYDPQFVRRGIEVSPLTMPLATNTFSFPALRHESFHGLPGLLADSIPDTFGNAVIDAWLATLGRTPASFNPVERLCYIGTRGMGALEFFPALTRETHESVALEVDQLVRLANEILSHRGQLATTFAHRGQEQAVRDILRIGSSAGGARAKALIAWNPQTQEVRSGQLDIDEGFEHWLLKFDGVESGQGLAGPQGYGAIEYAYFLMARAAGIHMSPCRLLEEGGRRHFMTRRFDRLSGGEKLHMQTLGALTHHDFNLPGSCGYEQVFQVIERLELGVSVAEEMYRRMVFNITACNQDDHVKNIAFLMKPAGGWSLAPAFDVIYSHNPAGVWTSSHQMTLNGRREGFGVDDFMACARVAGLKKGRAKSLIHGVCQAVSRWKDFAAEANVLPDQRDRIFGDLNFSSFA